MLASEGIHVVAELDSADDLIQRGHEFAHIDVILLQANPEIKDYALVRAIRERLEHAKIVIVADRQFGSESMLAAMSASADGVLLSELTPAAFMQSLHLICLGEKVMPAQLMAPLFNKSRDDQMLASEVRGLGFSDRELQILELIARGCANKVIAIELDIAEATVKSHVKAILRKTRVTNRTQAAVWALSHGLGRNDASLTDGMTDSGGGN
jgi:two-component system nitrate/nitrite response regulator NarL